MRWIGRRKKDTETPGAAAAPGTTAAVPLHAGAETTGRVRAILERHVVEISDGKLEAGRIDSSAPLFDYGYVDSLTSVSLIEMIRARYDVEVSEVDLVGRLNTLDALARHIAAASARPS